MNNKLVILVLLNLVNLYLIINFFIFEKFTMENQINRHFKDYYNKIQINRTNNHKRLHIKKKNIIKTKIDEIFDNLILNFNKYNN